MYKRILCPVDGSQTSQYGLMEAIRLAKDQQAALLVLHVIDMYFPMINATGDYNLVYMDEVLRQRGKKVLKKAEAACKKAGITAESKTLEIVGAKVAEAIIAQARTWPADLIVLGTHGLRGVKRMVMGSDAETIVRSSPVPVLLVRNNPLRKHA